MICDQSYHSANIRDVQVHIQLPTGDKITATKSGDVKINSSIYHFI